MGELHENRLDLGEKRSHSLIALFAGALAIDSVCRHELACPFLFRSEVKRVRGIGIGKLHQDSLRAVQMIADDVQQDSPLVFRI